MVSKNATSVTASFTPQTAAFHNYLAKTVRTNSMLAASANGSKLLTSRTALFAKHSSGNENKSTKKAIRREYQMQSLLSNLLKRANYKLYSNPDIKKLDQIFGQKY